MMIIANSSRYLLTSEELSKQDQLPNEIRAAIKFHCTLLDLFMRPQSTDTALSE